ncbi:RHS repeat domain-containing protein [Allomuricauda sp. F6463D]|uniref:RHS repeat domain-containing protein n=1 Tax=Allomuricauda sp. F6463D TaxID=2926409 RepID=UPI001FF63527|nr:RHS repeat domain-containing protein [Muricauda sp. F6463D]MCK0160137.1 RHS repeat protein [Muricauda sp. F6463D]
MKLSCCLYNGLKLFYQKKTFNFSKKSILLFVLTTLISNMGFSQEEDIFRGELNRIYNEVKSPESKAFENYGDTQVSLYSGTPQISVPLHTLKGREFSLPLSLTYDASGVKVEQLATWVGLSWNLNVGGRISRITNGLPDDYTSGGYDTMFNDPTTQQTAQDYLDDYAGLNNPIFPNGPAATDYVHFLYDVNLNRIDTQVDHFNLSAPGLNATVVLEKNTGYGFTARALNNPRIKITYNLGPTTPNYISSWTVTNEDGTKYIFSDHETTFRQNLSADAGELMGDANITYVSAWSLTQIVSKNGKDVFDFTYVDNGYEPLRSFASASGSTVTEIQENVYNYSAPPPGNISSVISQVKQRFPIAIYHNSKLLVEINMGSRRDVDNTDKNKRLASIDFLDWNGNVIKSVEFDNDNYFNSDGLSNANIFSTGKSYSDIRLKLDGVTIKGSDNVGYQNYYFEYFDPDGLPKQSSFAQDYYGYYNGKGNNSSLYPSIDVENFSFAGADREPSTNYGKKGTLSKITYPTGGYTEFDYEGHEIYTSNTSTYQDFILSANLNISSPTSHNLYTDDQGIYCDDKYMSPQDPRIVIKTITVIEEDDYILSVSSSNNDMEFYLVDSLHSTATYNNYCDFHYGPSAYNVVSPIYVSGNQSVHLTPGKYKALLLLGNLNNAQSISASATISKQVTSVNWNNMDVGGQRIAEIRDYTSTGNLALKKVYDYDVNFNHSSGTINYKPILHDFRENETENGSKTQLIRYATYAKGNEPYVTYSSVKESRVNGSNEKLGYTQHNFYKDQKGSVPMTSPPYENWYFPSLSAGNLSSKVINRETGNKTLVSEEFEYYETLQRPISIESLVVYVDNENFQKNIFLKQHNGPDGTPDTSDDFVSLEYLDTYECPSTPCDYPDYLAHFQNYGYLGYFDPKYSPYRARVSKTNGAYGGLDYYKKESIFYDANGNVVDTLVSEENTIYDHAEASPKYLPRKKTVQDSKENTIETNYTYPHDGIVNGSSSLVTKNILSEVVITETIMNPGEQDEQTLSVTRRDYGSFGTKVLPNLISTKKGNESFIDWGEFDYYSNGNIKTSKPIDGPSTYYIWGYDNQLPIMTITNFDDSDASSLQSLISACQLASDSDDGTIATENALRNAFENLRAALPNGSLMSSYTYDPTIGVTSTTDPRGYTTFYEYDEFNRLEATKDDDLKMLNDYQYHYKGQN